MAIPPAITGSVEPGGRLRLFLALRLPAPVVEAFAVWGQKHLSGHGRVVVAESLHVTLAFLGSQPAEAVPQIVDALAGEARAARPASLTPACYRETHRVGIVELDDAGGAARALAERLHGRLEELGVYRRERRVWLPHVTVLRFRARPHLTPGLPRTGTFVPSDAAAYLSRLHPSGSRYEVLESTGVGGTTG